MSTFFAWLGKSFLKIPVLFAHFPAPTILLVVCAAAAAATSSAWLTHKFESAARAGLRADLAECKAGHAGAVATAADQRAEIIQDAAKSQAAIDAENRKVYLAALRALANTKPDETALAALAQSIEELHRDAKFACRLDPLPDSHLERLRIPEARPHFGEAGSH